MFLTETSICSSIFSTSFVFLSSSALLVCIPLWTSLIWVSKLEIISFCLLTLTVVWFNYSWNLLIESSNDPSCTFFTATLSVESLKASYKSESCFLKMFILSFKLVIAEVSLDLWLSAVWILFWITLWAATAFLTSPSKIGISAFAALVFAVSLSIMSNKLAIALFAFSCL